MKFKLKGAPELMRKLERTIANTVAQANDALDEEATRILAEAQARVPIDTGELRQSGHVEAIRKGNRPRVVISFAAPHAVAVHENLTAQHSDGQAKFLESALDEAESTFIRDVGKRIDLKKSR